MLISNYFVFQIASISRWYQRVLNSTTKGLKPTALWVETVSPCYTPEVASYQLLESTSIPNPTPNFWGVAEPAWMQPLLLINS